jgi:hypothetical protein
VLLNGYRAQKPMDIISIAGAIAALSRLISERPDILVIYPVLSLGKEPVVCMVK